MCIKTIISWFKPKPPVPPQPPTPPPVEYINVRICHFDLPEEHVANEFCKFVETKAYVKGTEPTAICSCVPICDIPCDETGVLMIWSGALLGLLSMKDTEKWKEVDLPKYLNALVVDGVPAHRDLFCFFDQGTNPNWKSFVPWLGDSYDILNEEYYAVIDRRLKMFYDRKLTEVISLTPYGLKQNIESLAWDTKFESCIRTFVRRTKKYLPFIRYEAWNEPYGKDGNPDMQCELNQRMVDILKSEGVPNWAIQISFVDRSANSGLLVNYLAGQATMSLHWVGSMETIQLDEHPWESSIGTQWLMGQGLGSSDDGEDQQGKATGLNWGWLEALGNTKMRRPNNNQIYNITKWMLKEFEYIYLNPNNPDNYVFTGRMINGKLVEHLSAAGFQHPKEEPDLQQAIDIGRTERQMMRNAYNETVKR